ncbi:Arabinose 5-phosphate isomerase KpsF [Zancudomyces culisetae]|uniref:Arabinose 5-phosphate isomerase KpsF n=1 Tax=Zancudomyces culisetae TaxID=1213189 RepID=A0A1R1PSD6_ZANCU|nr:Arabinose 5-phosphate isomerase KpsF [Zancudomyces culisetae]|eukprot:OMH83864.1 Arabinose 5-phosphate isomerase KpsF [Zancudomyces culisetae]
MTHIPSSMDFMKATNDAIKQLHRVSENILRCSERIEKDPKPFQDALSILYKVNKTPGSKVVITGVGKSAKIGEKMAATLTSTGTIAVMMHSTEAYHGDLGLIRPGDCVIAISNSGKTEELLGVVHAIKRSYLSSTLDGFCENRLSDSDPCKSPHLNMTNNYDSGTTSETLECIECQNKDIVECAPPACSEPTFGCSVKIIALCGDGNSPLVQFSDVWIDVSVDSEFSDTVPAPTNSTTLTMAVCDAISINLMHLTGFTQLDFFKFHPGGSLGQSMYNKKRISDNNSKLVRSREVVTKWVENKSCDSPYS